MKGFSKTGPKDCRFNSIRDFAAIGAFPGTQLMDARVRHGQNLLGSTDLIQGDGEQHSSGVDWTLPEANGVAN